MNLFRRSSDFLTDLDRCELAETQLRMVEEITGDITQGQLRRAAGSWASTDDQYEMIKYTLADMVTA